jgi:carboxyvinyl-carboxyphosphonate phosphorylmutase
MDRSDRRRRFRAVLHGDRCVHPGSVFDPISARIAEDLGFEIGMFAGSVASFTVLGAPDLIALTLTEFAEQASRICRAGRLPLLVDADHGYGNALSVMRTVQELETAGVAALTIEDTDLPQPFAETKQRLIPLAAGVGKMRAAVVAREDKQLVLFARTSAAAIAGVEEAVTRVRAYAQTGVDGIFLVGLKTRAELEAIAAEVDLPLALGGAGGELSDRDYLERHGVRIALQGHQPFMAAVQATHDTLKALRDGVKPSALQGVAGSELMGRVTRSADYRRWSAEFLGG